MRGCWGKCGIRGRGAGHAPGVSILCRRSLYCKRAGVRHCGKQRRPAGPHLGDGRDLELVPRCHRHAAEGVARGGLEEKITPELLDTKDAPAAHVRPHSRLERHADGRTQAGLGTLGR